MTAIRRLQRKLTSLSANIPKVAERVTKKVMLHAYRRLIMLTPKGYTGQTRRSWKIRRLSMGSDVAYSVFNESKIMRFLEHGTSDHGPRTAKYLFIPLNRKTALGGVSKSSEFGTDYVLSKRVKGIKALKITEKRAKIVRRMQRTSLRGGIIDLIKQIF